MMDLNNIRKRQLLTHMNQQFGQFKIPRMQPNRFAGQVCAFCSGMHFSSNCRNFPTYNERIAYLKRANLCIRCLQEKDHDISNCWDITPCLNCGLNHNIALCATKLGMKDDPIPIQGTETEASQSKISDELQTNKQTELIEELQNEISQLNIQIKAQENLLVKKKEEITNVTKILKETIASNICHKCAKLKRHNDLFEKIEKIPVSREAKPIEKTDMIITPKDIKDDKKTEEKLSTIEIELLGEDL